MVKDEPWINKDALSRWTRDESEVRLKKTDFWMTEPV